MTPSFRTRPGPEKYFPIKIDHIVSTGEMYIPEHIKASVVWAR